MSRLTFSFDAEKFVEAAHYLCTRCSEVTKMKLFKLLYFADKQHLSLYGRPVIGGHYVAMKDGPVPSEAYDLVKSQAGMFHEVLCVNGYAIELRPNVNPGTDSLSESDLEVLEKASTELGHLTAAQLRGKSHNDPAWSTRSRNADMDYLDMVGNRDPQFMELLLDDQSIRDLVDDVILVDEPTAA